MIIVLVPELDNLLAEADRLPGRLAAIMARGQRRPLADSHYQSLLVCGQAVPPAALTRNSDCPADTEGCWLRADPVGLRPDLNAVWLQTGLDLADPEACSALTSLLAEEGLDFDLPHPGRGYLRLSESPGCQFVPPWKLSGQSLDHVLPHGPGQARWRRLLNECQILLHQFARGSDQPAPDGLWFWGAGSLPSRADINPRISHLAGADPLWPAMADWLGLSHAPGCPLRVADQSLVEWQADTALDSLANLELLDQWLKPLWRRLKRRGLDALELASQNHAWRVEPADAWRFWQRAVPELP